MTPDEAFEILRAHLEADDNTTQAAYEALDVLWVGASRSDDDGEVMPPR